ncbi:MAG: histidine kinase [Phenylobacterium sp.]|uniref:response regulator n=1 Tax=Phenylobacterium sp. TaxID=1871053 RepID=UPI0025CFA10C|nr:response regulator [Phenylobacterium sp.]MBA4010963.1 histidine kinase [Phenylobacterium sp.]
MAGASLPANSSPFARRSEVWTTIGLVAALTFFLISGAVAFLNVQMLRDNNEQVVRTHTVIMSFSRLLSALQDAETGQRGFVMTGDERYLDPYNDAVAAIPSRMDAIAEEAKDNPVQQSRIGSLRRNVNAKLVELEQTIALRRSQGRDAAAAVVEAGRGKAVMDAIRAQLDGMQQEEIRQRSMRLVEMEAAYRTAWISSILSCVLGLVLTAVVGLLVRRATKARAREDWLRSGQAGAATAMLGDLSLNQLGDGVLDFYAGYLGAQAGAIFASDGPEFRLAAKLGVPADTAITETFAAREGLLGQAVDTGKAMLVREVPEGYLAIGSALGRSSPVHLLIVPLLADGAVIGVMELGFLNPVDAPVMDLLEKAAPVIGVALRSAQFRSELRALLAETQRQAEELQVQSEELRVSNEELEEQGRALKESQVRLEQQQVELEQINTQLEEQAQQLETQRDDLARFNATVELKARELEQASRYKSDFLANMSHELRTPLNSLLILSKLLGDNPDGNLTEEQVKFARTIQSSGDDLLTLINDILDLSKIEAGHLQIRPETTPLGSLAAGLRQMFEPLAAERGLAFEIDVDDGGPASLETDRQRLEQILKNLLSNAFKFTEAGAVSLTIAPVDEDRLAFSVTDTGIGIAKDQQASIFQAFHQADGTISRRYGGTGLGLSISTELARLLGGTISVSSVEGQGSTFTLVVPLAYDPAQVAPRPAPPVASPAPTPAAPAARPAAAQASLSRAPADDRDGLVPGRRSLLIIEDDGPFAAIVRDLSRDLGFQSLIARTAGEALDLAKRFKPSAVVLDVGLPDQSGLTVLDQLKRDDETRHIPVHVVSASDHTQTALSLGAVGYLVKPVKREELAQDLQSLEAQLTRTVRRVLIVEDDEVQRDAVSRLLASSDVETVGVGTAAECLERLKQETFDCMVLDLTLPDSSGFALLETLSSEGGSFPPVIVYTGHDLSPDDEQQLRRYSHSIIIKGAKSPERLLDEVSLFLHQVVSKLPPEQRKMLRKARNRDAVLEGRRILIVEDDVRNIYSLSNILEPRGAVIEIARNGEEAIAALEASQDGAGGVDLVLMDVMMPVMDGLTATREIRKNPRWAKLPIVALTAKAMPDDQERCLQAGASDYMAKPLDVDKLLSLVRVWMPR